MMYEPRPFRIFDLLLFLVVLAAAAGARAWYLCEFALCGDANASAIWRVQQATVPLQPVGEKTKDSDDLLVANIKEKGPLAGFVAYAPLKSESEVTAHTPPGYPIVRAYVEQAAGAFLTDRVTPVAAVRWLQVVLGTLTAGFYFLLARRAFDSTFVGFLAGVFCALNPFAVLNAAEVQDGVLASFAVAASLYLGVRAGQSGGALTSFLFGLFLAVTALVRAACLPFAIVALLWFLLRSRQLRSGWLVAAVSFLGFLGGLAPWGVRNYQLYEEPVPIVSSAWWHLWVGNNPLATGGSFESSMEAEYRERIGADRSGQLSMQKQPARYAELREEIVNEVSQSPLKTLERRLFAGLYFFTSQSVLNREGVMAGATQPSVEGQSEADLLQRRECASVALYGTLVGMLMLGVLGWRWSYGWRWSSLPLSLAVMWIPLPYLLGHAETLHGPRLPLDGALLTLAAFAIAYVLPGSSVREGMPEMSEAPVPSARL
jgi:4-amino-4-deoxy-L-arabinose transferase-like glycosyltransferase